MSRQRAMLFSVAESIARSLKLFVNRNHLFKGRRPFRERIPFLDCGLRTDLSATLFLSAPEDYDGGELVIEDIGQRIKLPAGDIVLYSGTSVHRVEPVTRGVRLAAFFWVQSMVREDSRRDVLFQTDTALQELSRDFPGHRSAVRLAGAYHNLLRLWSDT